MCMINNTITLHLRLLHCLILTSCNTLYTESSLMRYLDFCLRTKTDMQLKVSNTNKCFCVAIKVYLQLEENTSKTVFLNSKLKY